MFTLSGFADEISPDLTEQLDTLDALGIRFFEFRGVWNANVLQLDDDQLAEVKTAIDARGIKVSSIGSPIGKIQIDDPMEPHLEAFERAMQAAEYFDCPYIRMFSFYCPEGQADDYRDQVLARLELLLNAAQDRPVTLLHENESRIYGDIPRRCNDILTYFDTEKLRFAFDPANFVMCGVKPFTEGYPLLKDYIDYLHIKDVDASKREIVPAGEGDGEVLELIKTLVETGYDGFASMEPHLAFAGSSKGFSGPELFERATKAFRKIMAEAGAQES